jgi:putative aminopeptidase FrvX
MGRFPADKQHGAGRILPPDPTPTGVSGPGQRRSRAADFNYGSTYRSFYPAVVKRLIALANELEIPIQHEASSRSTGTDTDHVYPMRGGVPSALLSVPLRYMHSTIEMVDLRDVERCVVLLTHFVRSIESDEEFSAKLG